MSDDQMREEIAALLGAYVQFLTMDEAIEALLKLFKRASTGDKA